MRIASKAIVLVEKREKEKERTFRTKRTLRLLTRYLHKLYHTHPSRQQDGNEESMGVEHDACGHTLRMIRCKPIFLISQTVCGVGEDPSMKKRRSIVHAVMLVGLVVAMSGCSTLIEGSGASGSDDSSVEGRAGSGFDGSSKSAEQYTEYEIGDTGPAGGIIFYDDEDDGSDDIAGARYLEAAPASTEWEFKEWGGYLTDINGDDATVAPELVGIGDGQANTTAIVTALGDNGGSVGNNGGSDYAAKLADDLEHNGYSDWFLPSLDELGLMYQNLHQQGLGGFAATIYWSSSEKDEAWAWYQNFDSGNQDDYYKFNTTQWVAFPFRTRAVRSFGN